MTFFGLITRDPPLIAFAYIGTAIVAGIVALVAAALLDRGGETAWTWLRGRNERIIREREMRREHS